MAALLEWAEWITKNESRLPMADVRPEKYNPVAVAAGFFVSIKPRRHREHKETQRLSVKRCASVSPWLNKKMNRIYAVVIA